ncbi:Uncharacterised protein [Porphyromonas cangingivalis]|nr:Uncharacterised protein [Porphyromonas cangingivalis]
MYITKYSGTYVHETTDANIICIIIAIIMYIFLFILSCLIGCLLYLSPKLCKKSQNDNSFWVIYFISV